LERTYQHIDLKNRLRRALWNMIYIILFRPFGTKLFQCWRNFLLRCFGAQIHPQAGVYSTAKVWCPWKLQMEENAWIGPNVNCYNVDWIKLGKDVTISQGAYLCTASHDISKSNNPLIIAPVVIEDQVWIGADAFVGMGVTIRQGAVVGARACVFKDVESWTVVGGNPAKFIKKRIIK
jgi:putative colanic acid biosynthesis acetyltransferase WcaF